VTTTPIFMVLKDTWTMYLHAHAAHWNVTGENFNDHHKFLNSLYDELWDAVDGIAEHIRALDIMVSASVLSGTTVDPGSDWTNIQRILLEDNNTVLRSLVEAFDAASSVNDQGLVNFLAGRLETHAKHGWMLRASS